MSDFTHATGEVAQRFQRRSEWYETRRDGDLTIYRVHAISERAVELFLRLSARLEAVVDVALEHPRDGRCWHATLRFLPDVRETLGRLRWLLATHGGVEIALVTPEEQLTLTTALEVVIFTRSDRWPMWLEMEGVPPGIAELLPVWNPAAVAWSPAPELSEALEVVVERLALQVGT